MKHIHTPYQFQMNENLDRGIEFKPTPILWHCVSPRKKHWLKNLPRNSRILVIRLRSMGDIILLTPMIRALKDYRPDFRVTVLVEPQLTDVIEGLWFIDEILPANGFTSTVKILRERNFHVVFNQHGGPRSAILTTAVMAPIRLCWQHRQFAWIYNERVPPQDVYFGTMDTHTVEHRMTQLYWLGMPPCEIPAAELPVNNRNRETVKQLLGKSGLDIDEPFIAIHPGANFQSKRWDLDSYREIIHWFKDKYGYPSVVVLGPAEQEHSAEIEKKLNGSATFFKLRSIQELISLIASCRLFMGNDSGPAHIAAATKRPIVSIFGSSDARVWYPWKTPHRVILRCFDCQPCRGMECQAEEEYQCIRTIQIQTVINACEDLLSSLN